MELEITAPATAFAALDCERELVEKAKRDRDAFAALYRRHYRTIATYVLRRVGHNQITEDLTADVFLIALRTLPRYRQRGVPVLAWLYRLAGNRVNRVNRWARRERGRAIRQLTAEPTDGGRPPGSAPRLAGGLHLPHLPCGRARGARDSACGGRVEDRELLVLLLDLREVKLLEQHARRDDR